MRDTQVRIRVDIWQNDPKRVAFFVQALGRVGQMTGKPADPDAISHLFSQISSYAHFYLVKPNAAKQQALAQNQAEISRYRVNISAAVSGRRFADARKFYGDLLQRGITASGDRAGLRKHFDQIPSSERPIDLTSDSMLRYEAPQLATLFGRNLHEMTRQEFLDFCHLWAREQLPYKFKTQTAWKKAYQSRDGDPTYLLRILTDEGLGFSSPEVLGVLNEVVSTRVRLLREMPTSEDAPFDLGYDFDTALKYFERVNGNAEIYSHLREFLGTDIPEFDRGTHVGFQFTQVIRRQAWKAKNKGDTALAEILRENLQIIRSFRERLASDKGAAQPLDEAIEMILTLP